MPAASTSMPMPSYACMLFHCPIFFCVNGALHERKKLEGMQIMNIKVGLSTLALWNAALGSRSNNQSDKDK
jgi:hypothetical protein